jgi:sigma-E factor negative regulatory protein RseA
MNEELDSQLSAMFDNELPAVQCELLARRLSRDEELKARWARYAAIGATIRAEGGPRLNSDLARRVSVAISAEPVVVTSQGVADVPLAAAQSSVGKSSAGSSSRSSFASTWWTSAGGVAVAASVAAAAILWVRYQSPLQGAPVVAQNPAVQGSGSNIQYVVPRSNPRRSIVPSTQLANYVVAHSEFSSPVIRRNLLSTLMASEPGTAVVQSGSDDPTEDVNDDAKSPQ